MRVTFGEYLPDQPPHLSNSLITADGVYAIANGYAPLASFSPMRNGMLPTQCIGAGGYRYTGLPYMLAATATDIYRYQPSGMTSLVTGLSGSPSIGVRFRPYNSWMLATNGVDPIKKFDPASPTTMTNLSSAGPVARFMAVVRGFLVLGYAGLGSPTSPSPLRVIWSDSGDPTNYATSGSSQAGQFDMPSGGDVTGIVGGEYGLVFQENRIVRMTYTADDAVWQFDEIATDAGCAIPKSLATWGRITFFLSNRGFMACDGTTVQAIGNEKVDRTFLSLMDRTYTDQMSAVVDPRNSLYIVTVPNAAPANNCFIYNYALQKWTTAKVATELLFSALSLGITLEDLSTTYPNLDTMTVSLDSAAFRGGYPLLLLFDGSHRLGSLSGPNLAATLADNRREYAKGRKARITDVRPLTDAPVPNLTISGTNGLADTGTATTYTALSRTGVFRTRENWQFAQMTLSMSAGQQWTYAQGFDVDAVGGTI